jgi:hypothetical protein
MTNRVIAPIVLAVVSAVQAVPMLSEAPDYALVWVSGGNKIYEYEVDLMEMGATLRITCEEMQRANCAIFAGTEKDSNVRALDADNALIRSRTSIPFGSVAALNIDRTLLLVAQKEPGSSRYRYDVYGFPTMAAVASGTTARRVSDAMWVGAKGCFTLLTTTEFTSLMPWYWLYALSGHPAQFDSYYLELYAPDGALVADVKIKANLLYSGGGFLNRRIHETKPGNARALRSPC